MTMAEERQKRIEKLPKWAQQYIGTLKCDVAWYKKQLAQASAGSDADVWWEVGTLKRQRVGVPTRASVYFRLENGTAYCMLEDGLLRIATSGGRLVVKPEGANVVSAILLKRGRR